MYVLDPITKTDPNLRWNLPDRIFFGHGACHILAGVYLEEFPNSGFDAYWVVPGTGYTGNHVYVSDGEISFGYHGYSATDRLLAHHERVWTTQQPDWHCKVRLVDFPLLETAELNLRNMRGPDQYLGDPIPRARRFLAKVSHASAAQTAREICGSQTR